MDLRPCVLISLTLIAVSFMFVVDRSESEGGAVHLISHEPGHRPLFPGTIPGTETIPHPAPTEVMVRPTWSTATITWKAVNETGSYTVKRSSKEGGPWITVGHVGGQDTSFTDTQLMPGRKYWWTVVAWPKRMDLRRGTVGTSSPVTATTKPLQLPNVEAKQQDDGILLTWTAVPEAVKYTIFRPGGGLVETTDETRFVWKEQLPTGSYRFQMCPVYKVGECADPPAVVAVNYESISGRYRITLTGFRVDTQTIDHALDVDGKGDEVFFRYGVAETDKEGKIIGNYINAGPDGVEEQTSVFGDVNGHTGRTQAGTASEKGGLVSGDIYPKVPENPIPPGGTYNQRDLPFKLWEGTLKKNYNAVAITPTVWEWDGNGSDIVDWLQWWRDTTEKYRNDPRIKTWITPAQPFIDIGQTVKELAIEVVTRTGKAVNRPIGGKWEGDKYKFMPRRLIFNFDNVEAALNGNSIGSNVNGVVSIMYCDGDTCPGPGNQVQLSNDGQYTLFLRVDRLN